MISHILAETDATMGCAGDYKGRDEALHGQTTKYIMMEEGEQVRRLDSARLHRCVAFGIVKGT